jgi:glycine/D-amino acid oxidase-like deaminating enzyme
MSQPARNRNLIRMAAAEDRERLSADVVVVGAAPAGLAAAIRLEQRDSRVVVTVIRRATSRGCRPREAAALTFGHVSRRHAAGTPPCCRHRTALSLGEMQSGQVAQGPPGGRNDGWF